MQSKHRVLPQHVDLLEIKCCCRSDAILSPRRCSEAVKELFDWQVHQCMCWRVKCTLWSFSYEVLVYAQCFSPEHLSLSLINSQNHFCGYFSRCWWDKLSSSLDETNLIPTHFHVSFHTGCTVVCVLPPGISHIHQILAAQHWRRLLPFTFTCCQFNWQPYKWELKTSLAWMTKFTLL